MIERAEKEKHRAEIFDALGHPARITILKSLSEGPLGFADLKKMLNIGSSGHLKHHLDKLDGLIKTDEHGKYCLSDEGKEALLTMQPIEKYDEDARFREQVGMLLRALRSDSPAVQDITIVQLSVFGSKALSYLTSALSHAFEELSEPPKRDSIRRASGFVGPITSGEGAERTITGIVKTLGIISAPSTIPDIMKALPRPEAFEALAKIANKQALDAIISSIPKWYSEYADAPHYSHDKWKASDAEEFLRRIFGYFGEDGRKGLEVALHEGNDATKNAAARILALVGDSHSFPALIDALENGDVSTKTEATKALHRLKASEALPTMVSELFRNQDRITEQDSASDRITEELHDSLLALSSVLAKAVLELGSIDDWLSVSFYRPIIEINIGAPGYGIRMERHYFDAAIIKSGEKAVSRLARLLQAPDPSVQSDAAEMIAKIKRGEKSENP